MFQKWNAIIAILLFGITMLSTPTLAHGGKYNLLTINQTHLGFAPYIAVNVTMNTASLISSSSLQSDCDDLLIEYNTTGGLINYSIAGCNTQNTNLTFQVNLTNGSNYFKIWYSNSSWSENYHNLTYSQAYWWFDDDLSSSSAWTQTGTCSIVGSKVSCSASGGGISGYAYIQPKSLFNNFKLEGHYKLTTADYINSWTVTTIVPPATLGNFLNNNTIGLKYDNPASSVTAILSTGTQNTNAYMSQTVNKDYRLEFGFVDNNITTRLWNSTGDLVYINNSVNIAGGIEQNFTIFSFNGISSASRSGAYETNDIKFKSEVKSYSYSLVLGNPNNAPVANITLSPLPISISQDEICNPSITDIDGTTNFYDNLTIWEVNGLEKLDAATYNKSVLGKSNYTTGDKVMCKFSVTDGIDWSINYTSFNTTVADTTVPNISSYSISSSSFYSDEIVNISSNCSDTASSINFVKVTLATIGTSNIQNFSQTLSGSNIYSYSQTFGVATYNLTHIYCEDTSTNLNILYPNTTFTITTRPSGGGTVISGGGGGGGSGNLPKRDCKIFLTPEQFEFSSNNNIQLLQVKNLEDSISYSPIISIPNGFLDIRGQLDQIIIAGKTAEITLVYEEFVQNRTDIELTLQSDVCKDIILPITLLSEKDNPSSIVSFEEYVNSKIGTTNLFGKDITLRLYHLIGFYAFSVFILLSFSRNLRFGVKVPIFFLSTIGLTLFSKLILDFLT